MGTGQSVILLTGASGFLGTYVRDYYSQKQTRLVCLSRTIPDSPDEHLWVQADIRHNLPHTLIGQVDSIVHLAAAINDSPSHLFQVNVLGTKTLIDFAEKTQAKKFIFLSTDDIYYTSSPYSQSKKDAEKIVTSSTIPWEIVRCPTIFGHNDSRNFAQLSQFIKKSPVIPLPFKGLFTWNPIFAGDVAQHIFELAQSEPQYSLTVPVGPEELTFRDIVHQLIRHHRSKTTVVPIPILISQLAFFLLSIFDFKSVGNKLSDTFKDKICTDPSVRIVPYTTKFSEVFFRTDE